MSVVLATAFSAAYMPDLAVMNDTLYGVNGRDYMWAYAGDSLRRACIRQPKVRRIDFLLGANYTATQTVITLDSFASSTTDFYKGCIIEVSTDKALITAYNGTTKVATLKVALSASNSYTTANTYCIHERFVATAATGSGVTDGTHLVQVTYYDANHDVESSVTELPLNNDYGSEDFNSATTSSQKITLSYLPKPRDSHVTHWRIYMTIASGTTYYRVGQKAIGTWDGTETYYIGMGDTELTAQPELYTRRDPFYLGRYLSVGKTRLMVTGQAAYTTGTIAVTNGSRTVTLTTGTWSDVYEDLSLIIDTSDNTPGTRMYTIESVEDSTHLTLDSAYSGTTRTSISYAIVSFARSIFYSEVDDLGNLAPENTYRAGDYIDVDIQSGATITGIKGIREGDQMIFTLSDVHQLTGEDADTFQVPHLANVLGLVSHRAAVDVDGIFMWQTPAQGIWTSKDGDQVEISKDCPTLFNDETLALDHQSNACAVYDKTNRIAYFSVTPTGASSNTELRSFYHKTGAWTRHDLVDAHAMADLEDENNQWCPHYLDAAGFLIKMDQQIGDKTRCTTRRGVVTSAGTTTSLTDSHASFTITNDGENGVWVTFLTGSNAGVSRRVYSNTATSLTLSSALDTAVADGDVYHLGCIHAYLKTGWLDLAASRSFTPSDYKLWRTLKIHCSIQDADYTTGQVILTNGSATVTGISTVWASSHIGKNFYVPGYNGIYYVKNVVSDRTITLNTTWAGATGGYEYKLGTRIWKVTAYPDYSATSLVTAYADMSTGIAEMKLNIRAQCVQFTIETYDEPTAITNPIKLRALEFEADPT